MPMQIICSDSETEHRLQLIEDALRKGSTRQAAAASAGISHTTFYEIVRSPDNLARIRTAELECRSRVEQRLTVDALTGDDWRPRVEWLKRRAKDEWSEQIDFKKLDDESLIRLYRAAVGEVDEVIDAEFRPEGSSQGTTVSSSSPVDVPDVQQARIRQ